MKFLKPLLLSAFLLFSGVFVASYTAPEGNGHVGDTASYAAPEGNGNFSTASYAAPKAMGIPIQRDTRPTVRGPGNCLGSRKRPLKPETRT